MNRFIVFCVALSAPFWAESQELPAKEKPVETSNSIGMRLVRVPAGVFMMGGEENRQSFATAFPNLEPSRLDNLADELPKHEVRISRPFYLGKFEVTVGEFRQFVEATGYVPESIADGTGGYGFNPAYDPATSPRRDAFEGRKTQYGWLNPGFPQTEDHPVVNVTWNDAQAMAAWLSRKEGKVYRLPTEAEWEYACRAGTQTRYHGGDEPQDLLRIANTFDQDTASHWPKWREYALPGSDGFAFTAPVGCFLPNAWGLHDMHGNVWEWVSDWYGEDYYRHAPSVDPQGPESGELKVRRGGSWHTWALYARSAFRNWNTPQTRYTLLGFRLLRETGEGGK